MPVPQEGRSAKPNGLKAPCEQAEFPPTGPRLQRLEPSIPDVTPFFSSLLGVSRATPVFSAAPFIAMVLAIIFLDEQLTVPIVVGALAAMAGVALIVSEQ